VSDALAMFGAFVASLMIILACAVTRPTRARCPDGWILSTGVRTVDGPLGARGTYACERPPIGGDTDVLTGKSTAVQPPGKIYGRVYCTGGSSPIVVDHRIVGCSR
jgi:hypothetical protein